MELTLRHSYLPRGINDWGLLFFFKRRGSLTVRLLNLLWDSESSKAVLGLLSWPQERVVSVWSSWWCCRRTLPFFCSVASERVAARWSCHLGWRSLSIRLASWSPRVTIWALSAFSILSRWLYRESCWLLPWGCEGSNSESLLSVLRHHGRTAAFLRRRNTFLVRGFLLFRVLLILVILLRCGRLLATITAHLVFFNLKF